MLTDGFVECLEIHGRRFNVQTEICDGTLRTEIFLAGRLMASREARLDNAELRGGKNAQRQRMIAHHQLVVSGIRERALRQQVQRDALGAEVEVTDSRLEGSDFSVQPLAAIDGFIGACLVDDESPMMLGAYGGGPIDLELATAGCLQVLRAERETMASLELDGQIDDILISLRKQYHVIRPLVTKRRSFLYLVLDRSKANLAMARHQLRSFEASLSASWSQD